MRSNSRIYYNKFYAKKYLCNAINILHLILLIIFLHRNNLVNFIYLLWKQRKSDAYVPFTIASFLSLFQSSLSFYSVLSSSIFTIQRLKRKFLQCNISLVCSRISFNGICYCLLYWRCFTFRNRSRKSYFHFLLYAHLTFVLPFFHYSTSLSCR